jgi:hypothetical protein
MPRWRSALPALLASLVLFIWQPFGALPRVAAQAGDTASTSIPVPASGRFGGMVAPQSSTWFHFAYQGGGQDAAITVTYLPADSSRLDLVVYTGSPETLRAEGGTADRTDNSMSWIFNDPRAHDTFVQVVNDHHDRAVSFVGRISPTSALEGPPRGTPSAAMGQLADTPDVALDVQPDGSFLGVLTPRQLVWYRFYYGAGGYTSTISATFTPNAGNARLELYTGPDVGHLTQQGDTAAASDTTLSRQVSLPNPQWIYFTLSNSSSSALLAHVGQLSPVFVPPVVLPTPTPVPPAPTPTPVPTPQPAPVMSHDQRFFPETRFRIEDDAIWSYFRERGQLETFGFPVSRTFFFLGCPVQIFQRQVVQICPGRLPTLLNLLDPEIFPYTRVNGSTFPVVDEGLKAATPKVSDPDYAAAIRDFLRANSPDVVDLEVWGAPISRPLPDPNNSDFVYQRFQRGIFHRIFSQGATRGILLADYLKAILRDRDLPADLRDQARESRFLAQYCPSSPGWLCRPGELEGTDLTFAFEQG